MKAEDKARELKNKHGKKLAINLVNVWIKCRNSKIDYWNYVLKELIK